MLQKTHQLNTNYKNNATTKN